MESSHRGGRMAVPPGLALAFLILCNCAAPRPGSEGEAVLRGPGKSGSQGVLEVHEANGGVHIRGLLMGLQPGSYALYVGDRASCRPSQPADGLQGPLLLFRTDSRGAARIDMVTSELRPAGGGAAVLGKSLVVEKAFPGEAPLVMAACGAVK
jgi:hypothetical protein